MLRRGLLTALVCVAVWVSGHQGAPDAAVASTSGAMSSAVTDSAGHVALLRPDTGHAGNPVRSTDVWQSTGAVVVLHTWRLDGQHAELSSAAPSHASLAPRTTPQTRRRSPPAPPHAFDLPLLI